MGIALWVALSVLVMVHGHASLALVGIMALTGCAGARRSVRFTRRGHQPPARRRPHRPVRHVDDPRPDLHRTD